jgi:hypothetical protein
MLTKDLGGGAVTLPLWAFCFLEATSAFWLYLALYLVLMPDLVADLVPSHTGSSSLTVATGF